MSCLIARLTGQPLAQAFLSCVPTSPVEAAAMAIKAGIAPVPIIFSQTLRLSAVVLIVPFALYALEGWPQKARVPVTLSVDRPVQIAILAAMGLAGAGAFRRVRIPNPNFLGPMAVAAAFAVSGHAPQPYPPVILAMAQIILGTWLGGAFRRDFVSSALPSALTSAASAVLLIGLCALSTLGIAALSEVDWRTLVLGSAPGGVVEMALTAKFLEQNVVLISTFHLVRIFLFMPNIPWIVRLIVRRDRRHQTKAQ